MLKSLIPGVFLAVVAAAPAAAQTPSPPALNGSPLAFNTWCFNTLLNLGVRHGFGDDHEAAVVAGHAMADARRRFDAAADSDRAALDQRYFETTQAEVTAHVAGTAPDGYGDRYDRCRAKGLAGLHAERRHAEFLTEHGEKLWCQATLSHFVARGMIGGGPERVARGETVARVLIPVIEDAFLWAAIGTEDRTLLLSGVYFRSLLQVDAFRITGDKARFERDYELCFAMADLPLPLPRFDFPPAAELRPVRTAAAWDYPLSHDFRHAAWCREAMRLADTDPLAARLVGLDAARRDEIASFADRLLADEAAAVGMPAAGLDTISQESRAQVAHEMLRYEQTLRFAEMAYGPGECIYVDMTEWIDDMLDGLDFQ